MSASNKTQEKSKAELNDESNEKSVPGKRQHKNVNVSENKTVLGPDDKNVSRRELELEIAQLKKDNHQLEEKVKEMESLRKESTEETTLTRKNTREEQVTLTDSTNTAEMNQRLHKLKIEPIKLKSSACESKKSAKSLEELNNKLTRLNELREAKKTATRGRQFFEQLTGEGETFKPSTTEGKLTQGESSEVVKQRTSKDAATGGELLKQLHVKKEFENLKVGSPVTDDDRAEKQLQELELEVANMKKAKKKTEQRTRTSQQCEDLRREIEKPKEDAASVKTLAKCKEELLAEKAKLEADAVTTTLEKMEYELLQKEVDKLKENATRERTRDRYRELKKVKAQLEDTADGISTKKKNVLLETELRAESKRKKEVNRILQLMATAQAVDLCFLVDCTGSMSSYIQGVKDKIQTIVQKTKRMVPDLKFSVAFVGYRDHCDGANRTVVLNFTTSILAFQSFMGSVEATGGGDTPEDVFGGLEEVVGLSWSQQTRILFHIADAPCHGTRFHDPSMNDNHSDGDPRGLQIESLLSTIAELKIFYWFAKLGSDTDLMIQVFSSIFKGPNKITEIDLASVDGLVDAVAGSISTSVNIYEHGVLESLLRGGAKGNLLSYKLVPRQPDWGLQAEKKVTVWRNKIPDDLDLLRNRLEFYREPVRFIKIAPNPFAEGSMRLVYHGKDCTDRERMGSALALKRFKYTGENLLDLYKEQMEIQSVAIALAAKFNSIKPTGASDIHFADVYTISVTNRETTTHFSAEKYIPGKYLKFNNNAGFVNEAAYTATLNAFSHWTYCATGKYLMVVDLQGVKKEMLGGARYTLTDPAIHSRTLCRFGRTNLGPDGMYRFFRTHYCNGICKAMALPIHRLQPTDEYADLIAGATVVARST